jgi:5-methylcytosine-specific restriction endonuclease McrA
MTATKREQRAAYMRRYRASHPAYRDYVKRYLQRYRAANGDKLREQSREWHHVNAARAAATKRAYYAKNKFKIIKKAREWSAAHKGERAAILARWVARNYKRHLLHHRRACLKRRAKMLGAQIETIDVSLIVARSNGLCGICGEPIGGGFDLDHKISLAKGGAHSNDNLQIAHPRCNRRKGARA